MFQSRTKWYIDIGRNYHYQKFAWKRGFGVRLEEECQFKVNAKIIVSNILVQDHKLTKCEGYGDYNEGIRFLAYEI